MSFQIIEVKDVLSNSDFEKLLEHTVGISEDKWKEMNDPYVTGKFWSNKRSMIPMPLVVSLEDAIMRLNLGVTEFSAINKVQRFYALDKLGPLRDAHHVDYLKVGLIFFLNSPEGARIEFPSTMYSIKAEPNKIVAYPADELYSVYGPQNADDKLYFMTVFGH